MKYSDKYHNSLSIFSLILADRIENDSDLSELSNIVYFSPHVSDFKNNLLRKLSSNKHRKYITSYFWHKYFSIESKRQYENELNKKNLIEFNQSVFNDAFNYIINEIDVFLPKYLEVKITVSESLYFIFFINNNYVVRIETFLEEQPVFDSTIENTSLIIEKDYQYEYGCFGTAYEAINKLSTYFEDNRFTGFSDESGDLTIDKDFELSPTF